MTPGSLQAAREFFRAIANASATWWCQARFWVQHIDLHPRYGVRMHSIQSLCKILKLQYIRRTHDSIFIRTFDETVMCGQVLGDHPGDFCSETRTDESCDHTNIPHALRIRARQLLKLRVEQRFDSEGISDVDLRYTHTHSGKSSLRSLLRLKRIF